MNKYGKKTILCLVFLVLSVVLFQIIGVVFNITWIYKDDILARADTEAAVLEKSLNIVYQDTENAYDEFFRLRGRYTGLMADLLRSVPAEDGDELIQSFEEGYVVKAENGSVSGPPGIPEVFLSADIYTQEDSETGYAVTRSSGNSSGDHLTFVFYSHIKGPYYYAEAMAGSETEEELSRHAPLSHMMEDLEKRYGIPFALYSCTDDGSLALIHASQEISEDSGITELTSSAGAQAMDMTVSGGRIISVRQLNNEKAILVTAVPLLSLAGAISQNSFFITAVMILFILIMIVWTISVYLHVEKHRLTEEQKNAYSPAGVRRYLISFGLLTLAAVYLIGLFAQAVYRLQNGSAEYQRTLELLDARMDETDEYNKTAGHENAEISAGGSRRAADFLARYPDLQTEAVLDKISAVFPCSYITLYDENGIQTVSTNNYISLSLGTAGNDPTTRFRDLLKGTKIIITENMTDYLTDEQGTSVGVRIPQSEGSYGAMVMTDVYASAYSPGMMDVNQLMEILADSDSLIAEVDNEKDMIIRSGAAGLIGTDADDYGFTQESRKEDGGDFFLLDNVRYFGVSRSRENNTLFYAVRQASMFSRVIPYAVYDVIQYLIIYAMMYLILTAGYTGKEFEEMRRRAKERHNAGLAADHVNVPARRRDRRKRIRSLNPMLSWRRFTPEQKAMTVFRILSVILIGMMFVILLTSSGEQEAGSIFSYLLYGSWSRGFNLFALCSTVIAGFSLFGISIFIDLLLTLISNLSDIKGETICRLAASVTHYFCILAFLYLGFAYLGVDPSTLNVSATIVTLTLTMGSQDLVTDLFAGISIVFEGLFSVGDIIEVNGFRGTVLEIGVRSTKLLGRGGNVKSIPNVDVKNTLNLTRMHSRFTLEVSVPNTVSVMQVENLLNTELPKIGSRIPEAVKPPVYRGLININNGRLTFAVSAECDEDDYFTVQRKLTREILLMFEAKGIPLAG